jgi:hypothetical protein
MNKMKLKLKLDANDQDEIAMEQRQSILATIEKIKSSDVITVAVWIGNSDDGLSQRQWSEYINEVFGIIKDAAREIHFSDCFSNFDPQQNACFVFEIYEAGYSNFCASLKLSREHHGQDSIAHIRGDAIFI